VVKNPSYLEKQSLAIRKIDKSLYDIDWLPHIDHLSWLTALLDLLQLGDRLSFVLELAEHDRLFLLANVQLDAVADESQLKRTTLPCLGEQVGEWKLDVLWFTLVEELEECHELLVVETFLQDVSWQLEVFNLSKAVKHFAPIKRWV
jgi:hypothetical protein